MTRRLGTAVLLLTLPSLSWGQSLGEIAQKEKERRKQNEQAGVKSRVVTEEDLKNNKGQLANDPGTASPKAATTQATKPAQSESLFPEEGSRSSGPDRRQQEASWRARVAQARERLEEAKKTYEYFNSQYLAQGERFVDEHGNTVIASVEQLRALIAKAKAAMDAAQKALVDLEESARRQNIPPGWLR